MATRFSLFGVFSQGGILNTELFWICVFVGPAW